MQKTQLLGWDSPSIERYERLTGWALFKGRSYVTDVNEGRIVHLV